MMKLTLFWLILLISLYLMYASAVGSNTDAAVGWASSTMLALGNVIREVQDRARTGGPQSNSQEP